MQLKDSLTSSTYKQLSKGNNSWKDVKIGKIKDKPVVIDLDSLVFFYMRKHLEQRFAIKRQRRTIRTAFVENIKLSTKQSIRELAHFCLKELRLMVTFVENKMDLMEILYSCEYPDPKLELYRERLEKRKVLKKKIPQTSQKKKLDKYINQYILGLRDEVRDIVISKFSHKLLRKVEETDKVCPRISKYVITEDVDIFLFGKKNTTIIKPFLLNDAIPQYFICAKCKAYLAEKEIQYHNFLDIAFLMGTDYNRGIKGMGEKKSIATISKYGNITKFLLARCDITDAMEMLEMYQNFVEYVRL